MITRTELSATTAATSTLPASVTNLAATHAAAESHQSHYRFSIKPEEKGIIAL